MKKNRATNTCSTILYVIKIPNREERMKQGIKKKKQSEDIMAENIPKQTKERYQPKIQEAQLTLHRINTKYSRFRQMPQKPLKSQDKEKILKATKGKAQRMVPEAITSTSGDSVS